MPSLSNNRTATAPSVASRAPFTTSSSIAPLPQPLYFSGHRFEPPDGLSSPAVLCAPEQLSKPVSKPCGIRGLRTIRPILDGWQLGGFRFAFEPLEQAERLGVVRPLSKKGPQDPAGPFDVSLGSTKSRVSDRDRVKIPRLPLLHERPTEDTS
jgi:hypothetical protein